MLQVFILPTASSRFSVSASKWQVEFFKEQPNQVRTNTSMIFILIVSTYYLGCFRKLGQLCILSLRLPNLILLVNAFNDFEKTKKVKELVKRAKAWRNQAWSSDPTGKPKSYLIAVLIVRAFERASKTICGDVSFPRLPNQ